MYLMKLAHAGRDRISGSLLWEVKQVGWWAGDKSRASVWMRAGPKASLASKAMGGPSGTRRREPGGVRSGCSAAWLDIPGDLPGALSHSPDGKEA